MEEVVMKPAKPPVSGFWRRVGAFLIDSLLLGIPAMVVGFVLFDELAALGGYGRLAGFAIALAYFGLMNSRLGGGQTMGKGWLGIRATTLDGELLSVPRSLARYSVLGIPFFLNGAQVPASLQMSTVASCLLTLVVFGGMFSILYLLVFNRATRRSLHDYAVGSWVVRAEAEPGGVRVPRLWRVHAVVVGVVMLAALLAPLALQRVAKSMPYFDALHPALAAITAEPGVQFATLVAGASTGTHGRNTYTAASVNLTHGGIDDEALARRLAQRVIEVSPKLGERDVVAITLRRGYDLGIASSWRQHVYRFAPEELAP